MPDKIKTISQLKGIVGRLRHDGKKVVFTNGCFDILHRGHIEYLAKAKKLGYVLIVGLNSDSSVKKIKGAKRPINKEKDRAVVLSALESVDYVVIFKEPTPYELIKAIRPDVLAKGADWKPKDIVGSDIAKKVVAIPFVKGYSTSGLLEKLGGDTFL
jgi:D-beta-D-heptose 7-phosphate kinase/D-beta-D-heptose 1-phosphate adenosyltransferase